MNLKTLKLTLKSDLPVEEDAAKPRQVFKPKTLDIKLDSFFEILLRFHKRFAL